MPTISSVKFEKTWSLPGIAFCAAMSADNSVLYAGLSDFSVRGMDPKAEPIDPKPISDARHNSYVTGLVCTGTELISGSYDGSLLWWNTADGSIVRRIEKAHASRIRRLALSSDRTLVASVADDMRTRLWNVADGAAIADWGDYELKTATGYPSMLYAVAFSRDGKWLATGDKTGHILVRALPGGDIAARLETPVMYTWDPTARQHSIGGIRSLAFSSDSKLLAAGGIGKIGNVDHLEGASRIEVFRWESGERLYEIEDTTFRGLVERLQFIHNDQSLVAIGGDHIVSLLHQREIDRDLFNGRIFRREDFLQFRR